MLNKEDFIIVQEGENVEIDPTEIRTQEEVQQDVNILDQLNAMSCQDAANVIPEMSETETVGSVSDREEGLPPVKKSKRTRKVKKPADM